MAAVMFSKGALVSADPPGPPTDEIYFTFNSESGTITDYDDEGPTDVIIPSTIGGVTVTSIATEAFNGNPITSVYIPETIELIEPGGFYANTSLESIMFGPDGYAGPAVLEMPDGAFSGMDNLTTVIDNGTVVSYGAAFSSPELTTLDLTNSQATTFSNGAFSETKLTSVFIPNSATLIENSSFSNNELLTEVTLGTEDYVGSPVLEVTNGSFFYYDETPTVLSSIVDNGTLKGVYYGSFEGLTSLTSLDFSQSQVETIVDSFDKLGLVSLQLPNSLTTLTDSFANSSTLTTIIFGTEDYEGEPQLALTSGFNSFPVLETIIDNGIISAYDAVFIGVPDLETFDVTRSQATAFVNGAFSDTGLTTIEIPNSAEVISGGTFAYNESLTEVILGTPDYSGPAKLAISGGSFSADLLSLTSVVDNGLTQSITGGSFNAPTITSIDFANSQIEVISEGAFYNTKIESLFIPNSVTAIEYGAFDNSTLLSEITFGTPDYTGPAVLDITGAMNFDFEVPVANLAVVDNGIIKDVQDSFMGQSNLISIDLEKSQIEEIVNAFSGSALGSLYLPDSLETLDSSFSGIDELETITFGSEGYDGDAKINVTGSFNSLSGLKTIVDNGTVLSYTGSVNGVMNLETLDLDNSQIESFNGGFAGTKIQALLIPNSTTAISGGAFSSNPSLTHLTFGTSDYSGPAVIAGNGTSFSSVPALTTIVDNGLLKSTDAGFLNSTPALTTLDFTRSQIESITHSFGSNKLETLRLPDSLTALGAGFNNSSALETIIFGSDDYAGPPVLNINSGAFLFSGNIKTIIDNGTVVEYDGAFSSASSQLETLDLTRSQAISIGSGAFSSSQLTELFLPDSLESISSGAFQNGHITKITVAGDVVLTDGAAFAGNVANTGEFIQLYTVDPANPHGYTNYISEDEGDIVFAYIVNPAQVTTNYHDEDGDALRSSLVEVGDGYDDYTVAANMAADLSVYYQAGESFTTPVPSITGYDSPAAITRQLKQANHSDNTFTLVYAATQEDNGDEEPGNNNAPGSGAGTGGGLINPPNTGNENAEDGEDQSGDESTENQPAISGAPKVEKTEDGRYTITIEVRNATSVELYDGTTLLDRQVVENSDELQAVTLSFESDDDSERKLIVRVNNALLGTLHEQTVTVGTQGSDSTADGSIPGWVWIITGVGAGGIILTWTGVTLFRGRGGAV